MITEITQEINLIEGCFPVSEALDIVKGLIDVKINHHKLQILSMLVHDDRSSSEFHSNRIIELQAEKRKLSEYLCEARDHGKQVQMHSNIHISFV